MSNVNNQYKELINEAIHNHFHDKTKIEMMLKDWLYGVCEQLDEYESKAKAFDCIVEEVNSAGKTMYKKESLVGYAVDNAFWNIDGIIVDYESGVDNE